MDRGTDRDTQGTGAKALIYNNMSLVHGIARKVKRSVGASIEFDDLVGYGAKGLVEAAERYDGRAGVAFTTFAYYRIRGAMYDGLRTMGWYSRADYARYRAEERANELLRTHSERAATPGSAGPEDELPGHESPRPEPETKADALAAAAELLASVATVHITSLAAAATIADQSAPAPDASVDMQRLSTRLREAIEGLPAKERRLMQLYYYSEKTLEEAGGEMGLSKSWACRLHARAVCLLRDAMADVLD
jgi:RNA polymerase sigma factor for flagellar operon FliA